MLESKVYILGAGCSKDCGYPLGLEMKVDLERFGESLDPVTCPRLRKAVADTVTLMAGTTETIDVLVQKLYAGQLDSQIGGNNFRDSRVLAATLATSAAFLAKEPLARQTGFGRYREFIADLFPGAESHWFAIPRSNRRHVLTFNYDRLFEMAFLDRFETSIRGYGLYASSVLNCGVPIAGLEIDFTPDAFSFLKLHGSVGAWTVGYTRHPRHQQCHFETPVAGQLATVADSYFFSEGSDGQHLDHIHPDQLKRPPVLFFPYQRQFIVSKESGFPFDRYARAVWNRAKELISNATEIHVIGYSFSGIDRGPMLDLLEEAHHCRRLVIQSPGAKAISDRLGLDRPQFGGILECAPFAF